MRCMVQPSKEEGTVKYEEGHLLLDRQAPANVLLVSNGTCIIECIENTATSINFVSIPSYCTFPETHEKGMKFMATFDFS